MGNGRYVGRNLEIVGCPCPQSKFGARSAKDIHVYFAFSPLSSNQIYSKVLKSERCDKELFGSLFFLAS